MSDKAKTFYRYIGKVMARTFSNGDVGYRINLDNVAPEKDGKPNQYHVGQLIWVEAGTGNTYLVKQLELKGVSDKDSAKGAINSVAIALEDGYAVEFLGSNQDT